MARRSNSFRRIYLKDEYLKSLRKQSCLSIRTVVTQDRVGYLDIFFGNFSVVNDDLPQVAHLAHPHALVRWPPVVLHVALVTVGVGWINVDYVDKSLMYLGWTAERCAFIYFCVCRYIRVSVSACVFIVRYISIFKSYVFLILFPSIIYSVK